MGLTPGPVANTFCARFETGSFAMDPDGWVVGGRRPQRDDATISVSPLT
jgi:hypothetical protein